MENPMVKKSIVLCSAQYFSKLFGYCVDPCLPFPCSSCIAERWKSVGILASSVFFSGFHWQLGSCWVWLMSGYGGRLENRKKGEARVLLLPCLIHCLSGFSCNNGVFLHSFSFPTIYCQRFQLLLGGPRSTFVYSKGSKGFLLLLIYGMLCKWWARWFPEMLLAFCMPGLTEHAHLSC